MSSETTTVQPTTRPLVSQFPVVQHPVFIQRVSDANRRKRRALTKLVGKRQFKKMYREANA